MTVIESEKIRGLINPKLHTIQQRNCFFLFKAILSAVIKYYFQLKGSHDPNRFCEGHITPGVRRAQFWVKE